MDVIILCILSFSVLFFFDSFQCMFIAFGLLSVLVYFPHCFECRFVLIFLVVCVSAHKLVFRHNE